MWNIKIFWRCGSSYATLWHFRSLNEVFFVDSSDWDVTASRISFRQSANKQNQTKPHSHRHTHTYRMNEENQNVSSIELNCISSPIYLHLTFICHANIHHIVRVWIDGASDRRRNDEEKEGKKTSSRIKMKIIYKKSIRILVSIAWTKRNGTSEEERPREREWEYLRVLRFRWLIWFMSTMYFADANSLSSACCVRACVCFYAFTPCECTRI